MDGMDSSITVRPPWQEALLTAITRAGGKTALMRQLNERGWEIQSHNVIGQWVANGVPAKYCPDIEEITEVSCESLCPDVKWGLVRDRRTTDAKPAHPAQSS